MYLGIQIEFRPSNWLLGWNFRHREDWSWIKANLNVGPLELCFGWYDKEWDN